MNSFFRRAIRTNSRLANFQKFGRNQNGFKQQQVRTFISQKAKENLDIKSTAIYLVVGTGIVFTVTHLLTYITTVLYESSIDLPSGRNTIQYTELSEPQGAITDRIYLDISINGAPSERIIIGNDTNDCCSDINIA